MNQSSYNKTREPVPTAANGARGYDLVAIVAEIKRLREKQLKYAERTNNTVIAEKLNEAGFIRRNGRPWDAMSVGSMVHRYV